jgi:hypothetical protein
MFDPVYLRDLSCRLHLLSRDCFDLGTAGELRRVVDELRAKADDAESLSAFVCTVPECSRRTAEAADRGDQPKSLGGQPRH